MNYIPLVARIFLSVIFLRSGISKILDFGGTQQQIADKGIPLALTGLLLASSIILELAGGLSVLLGYKARWGAIALIVFLVPTTYYLPHEFCPRNAGDSVPEEFCACGGTPDGGLLRIWSSQP